MKVFFFNENDVVFQCSYGAVDKNVLKVFVLSSVFKVYFVF